MLPQYLENVTAEVKKLFDLTVLMAAKRQALFWE